MVVSYSRWHIFAIIFFNWPTAPNGNTRSLWQFYRLLQNVSAKNSRDCFNRFYFINVVPICSTSNEKLKAQMKCITKKPSCTVNWMIVSSFHYANKVNQINMHESTLNRTKKKVGTLFRVRNGIQSSRIIFPQLIASLDTFYFSQPIFSAIFVQGRCSECAQCPSTFNTISKRTDQTQQCCRWH